MSISPYVWTLGATVLVAAGLGAVTWRHRSEPGATALTVLLGTLVFWSGGYAVALVTRGAELRVLMEQVTWLGAAVAPVAWFAFALQYTGYGHYVTRRSVATMLVPSVATVALVWTNPLHHLVWLDTGYLVRADLSLLVRTFGPAYWAFLLYAYTLVLAGIVLLLRLVFTAEYLFVDQAIALLVGALVPLAAHFLSLFEAPMPGLELTPHAFAVSGVTIGYALHRSELLDRIPATRRIGRTAVVRNMRDGVVVLDEGDVVVDVNPIAEQQFDFDRGEVVGSPVEAVFDDAEFALPDDEDTVVWSGRGPFEFEIQTSALTDHHGRDIGRVLVVRDITDRTNRRQQLQVLNRVLRHNFRNDMNVIDVCAAQLSERLAGENEELADRIRVVARNLAEMGTKAHEIEHIMSRRNEEPQPVDLSALVERQVDTLRREYPAATVETDLPPALEVQSTGVIEPVLQNVLENAVVHNDDGEPWVRVGVEASPGDDEVAITVADDGPGIPRQERDVLIKGTETPLEHGSGLGLWLVNWGVSMLGGSISFEDRTDDGETDHGGSVVEIRIPRRQTAVRDISAGAARADVP